MDYINRRPNQMNADVTFSATIVEANLVAALSHENARHLEDKYLQMLVAILTICDSTRRQLLNNVAPGNEDVRLLQETLSRPSLWIRKIKWRRGVLGEWKSNSKLTHRDVRNMVMQGIPKEKESDECLAEIVRNRLNRNCAIPDYCYGILANLESTRGYPLTHRLLMVQVAKAMKCDQDLPSSKLTLSYCSAILEDLHDIEAAGFPYQTPDLMMEQVVLCGMEGFLEFTGDHYERLVLNRSHPSGCFSSFKNKPAKDEARVSRRASKQTDFGCDSHATGLAAASLSLFIRENLENTTE
ncbi:UPF0764 protein C16orf89 like protein [Habropoda laboriosa]|uniref:UPF0764 protein C16orf89 like protein n=2 Tax=Habropoda laboriosa TaxID=597456 RepID=A0A0L7QPX9_9HYME|nr:UPF0764 protein C16orf89 like protein [Habropoda laboriosa]